MAAERPRRIILVADFVIVHQRRGTANRRLQIFCLSGHFVQPQVRVAVFANHMGLDEIFAVLAPAGIISCAWICGRIWHTAPRILRWRCAVLQFVVDEMFQEFQRARIACVRLQTFDKSLHHGAQVAGRVHIMHVRNQFISLAIEIEAAIKIRQPLAIVLIPDNGLR